MIKKEELAKTRDAFTTIVEFLSELDFYDVRYEVETVSEYLTKLNNEEATA